MSLADVTAFLSSREPAPLESLGTPRKLSAQDAISIYRDKRPGKVIAAEWGVTKATVSRIQRGLLWANVTRNA